MTLADMTEREWQAQVVELAKMLGWDFVYHTYNSRRSAHGFPDLLMLRERQVTLELKTEKGKLSAAQKDVGRRLLAAGQEHYVVRPRDLEALGKALAYRGDPFGIKSGGGVELERPMFAYALREQARLECRAQSDVGGPDPAAGVGDLVSGS